MYTPSAFRETRDEVLADLIDSCPFATLVVAGDAPCIQHVPLLRLPDGRLQGHVARGNALAGRDGAALVAVFHGPQGYVSPNWYPSKQVTGREVPTWNYAVAHAHGRLRVMDDAAWLRDLLVRLSDRHEATEPRPWSVDEAPEDHVQKLLRGIVGIEIRVERVEGKFKLSQNHPAANRAGVVAGLRQRGQAGDAALAALMLAQGVSA